MHDRKNENDTVKDARRAANEPPDERQPVRSEVDDGKSVTPRAVAKREARERIASENEAEAGHLGSGIGDDRPGRAPPHEGEPD